MLKSTYIADESRWVTEEAPSKGHWDKGYGFPDGMYYKCSSCGSLIKVRYPMNYCCNCGSDNRGEK